MIMKYHTQYPQKVNVWYAIIDQRFLDRYFFEETLTGAILFSSIWLYSCFIPNDGPDLPSNNLFFQRDGAPIHYAANAPSYLIRKRVPIKWSARSPDLTSLED